MRKFLVAGMIAALLSAPAFAGDPVPGIGVALELGSAPVTSGTTDREGVVRLTVERPGSYSLYLGEGFEGAGEVTISVNGTEIMRPITPCESQEGRVRVINFEAAAGQSIVVRVERPEREPARPRR